jgi:hypothetical protein
VKGNCKEPKTYLVNEAAGLSGNGLVYWWSLVDCHDREVVAYELALRGHVKEAERAL